MTDTAPAGSVVADAPPAGTPAKPPEGGEKGSAPNSETPFSGLSEGTRKWVETKGYKSHEDIAAAAMNAEGKIGSMVSVPGQDAKPEEWDSFYSKLPEPLRPAKAADKIEYKRPEGLPPDLPYSDDLANASKQWAVEAGASPKTAQIYHDKFVTFQAEAMKAQQAAIAKAVETTHDALVKEWGPTDSEAFKKKHALADRGIKKLGLTEAFQKAGIILPDGALTDPQLAKAFSAVGETMFSEDTIDPSDKRGTGENPFKRGEDGKIKSPAAISALIQSDPDRAKLMAREAGERIEDWMPNNPR